eukprot:jgi/Tetstr1/426090/TSEL_016421.t1
MQSVPSLLRQAAPLLRGHLPLWEPLVMGAVGLGPDRPAGAAQPPADIRLSALLGGPGGQAGGHNSQGCARRCSATLATSSPPTPPDPPEPPAHARSLSASSRPQPAPRDAGAKHGSAEAAAAVAIRSSVSVDVVLRPVAEEGARCAGEVHARGGRDREASADEGAAAGEAAREREGEDQAAARLSRALRAAPSVEALAALVEEHLLDFTDNNAADAAAALRDLSRAGGRHAPAAATGQLLASHVARGAGQFRPAALVRAATILASLGHSAGRLLPLLEARLAVPGVLADMPSPHLAYSLQAAALHRGARAAGLVDGAAGELARRGAAVPGRHLALALTALARLKYQRTEVLGALACAAGEAAAAGRLPPRDMAHAVWALGRLRAEAPELYAAAGRRVVADPAAFSPASLARIALGLSNAQAEAPGALWAVARDAAARAGEYGPVALAQVAWAASRGGELGALAALAEPAAAAVGGMAPPDVVRLAVAFARAGEGHEGLWAAVCAALLRPGALRALPPSQLAQVGWALAAAGHYDAALVEALAAVALPCVAGADPQDLPRLLLALAQLRHGADRLLAEVARAWGRRLDAFSPQGLSLLAYACVMLQAGGPAGSALLPGVAAQLVAHHAEFSPSELALTAWSLAAGGALSKQAVDALAPGLPALELNRIDMCQLYQAHLAGQQRLLLDGELLAECAEAAGPGPPLSDAAVEVSDVLLGLGVPAQLGSRSPDGMVPVGLEAPLPPPLGPVAVEVDGPSRFLRNASATPTGAAALWRRLLLGSGFRAVVTVPSQAWEALPDEPSKQLLLRDLFARQAGIDIDADLNAAAAEEAE